MSRRCHALIRLSAYDITEVVCLFCYAIKMQSIATESIRPISLTTNQYDIIDVRFAVAFLYEM